jgi:hypothetical protein
MIREVALSKGAIDLQWHHQVALPTKRRLYKLISRRHTKTPQGAWGLRDGWHDNSATDDCL